MPCLTIAFTFDDPMWTTPRTASVAVPSTNESWPPLRHNSSLSGHMINFLSTLKVDEAKPTIQVGRSDSLGGFVRLTHETLATVLLGQPTQKY